MDQRCFGDSKDMLIKWSVMHEGCACSVQCAEAMVRDRPHHWNQLIISDHLRPLYQTFIPSKSDLKWLRYD